MNQVELFKALSNPIRLQILTWLKDPSAYFPPQGLHIPEGDSFENAVCVGSIQEKLGISQSTFPLPRSDAAFRPFGVCPFWKVDLLPKK